MNQAMIGAAATPAARTPTFTSNGTATSTRIQAGIPQDWM
jgi:hypothetical protein